MDKTSKNGGETAKLRGEVAELKAMIQQLAGRGEGVGVERSGVVGGVVVSAGSGADVVTGRGGGSSSEVSWADEMEEELSSVASESSVTMPEQKAIGEAARGLAFGEPVTESFYAQYVKTEQVKALDKWLRKAGVRVSKRWMEELALSRYAQGTVPVAFLRGRERLRALAKVGDNVMLLVLTDSVYFAGETVGHIQDLCGRVLSRNSLSKVGVGSGLVKHIVYPAGVDPLIGSTTGEAVEAVAAVVFHSQGIEGVKMYMRLMQLIA